MSEFTVVPLSTVPPTARAVVGRFARLYIALLDADKNSAICVPTRDGDEGAHIKRNLVRIAQNEGRTVEWRRSPDFKKYFFWLEAK